MSLSMLSMHTSTAAIAPASALPAEEEHVLATIGHLPEPYVEAAGKVLGVTELLESILLQVGKTHLTTLLLSQRVNMQFFNTIKHSIRLRRALFFELDPPKRFQSELALSLAVLEGTDKPRLNPYVHYEGDQDLVITRGRRCGDEKCTHSHPGNANRTNLEESWWFLLLQAGWISPLNIEEDDMNASWRKMWMLDPPIEIHQIGCTALKGEGMKLLKMGPLMDKVREAGVEQRTRPGSHLESYFEDEEGAPRYMKIPPSKINHERRDRELEAQYQWQYTKVVLYFIWWMLIMLPVVFGKGVYIGFATFYASIKIICAVFWVRKDRKATREAKLLEFQQKAKEEAARLAKAEADEAHFQELVQICALEHDVTPQMLKAMRTVFYRWIAEGKLKLAKKKAK